MKKFYFILLSLGFFSVCLGQLKAKERCGAFVVDILDGKVNGIKPGYTMEEIKTTLPCFTSVAEEGTNSKCGGEVFYKDKDIYFYTQRNYIEIGEKFQGKLSIPLLGAKRGSLFKWLGNPKIADTDWEAFQMAYGTLVLHYNSVGKVKLIQFSSKSMDVLNLCE